MKKICAIVSEFNPFHNGHEYLVKKAKELSGCDFCLCIMSGDFTQRGEMCVADKYARARHAVLGGADCVIQLPTPFAVSPAEIFSRGAVKILSAVPAVDTLAFGCENADCDFFGAARILSEENDKFKEILSKTLAGGESYIKSYGEAFGKCGGNKVILSKPNNILAVEYAKAILKADAKIKILPIERVGAGYGDGGLCENYSSAKAIRNNLSDPLIKNNLPPFVDAGAFKNCDREFDEALRFALFSSSAEELRGVYGCTEGLENKLKSLQNSESESIIAKATSKRYPSARIKRILCANLLKLSAGTTERYLKSDLYIRVLAVKKERADEVLPLLAQSDYPVISSPSVNLSGAAKECADKDGFELSVYNHIARTEVKDYMILV